MCCDIYNGGWDVTIIANGPTRHNSKQASSNRKAERVRSRRIEPIYARIELASLLQKISKEGESVEQKEIKTRLEKKITSRANARYRPDDLARQLEEKVEEFNKSDDAENVIRK